MAETADNRPNVLNREFSRLFALIPHSFTSERIVGNSDFTVYLNVEILFKKMLAITKI